MAAPERVHGTVILRMEALQSKIGLGRSTIYDRLDKNSPRYDPSFPAQVSLGGVVGWREADVDAWLASLPSPSSKRQPRVSTDVGAGALQEPVVSVRESLSRDTGKYLMRKDIVRSVLEKRARCGQRIFYDDLLNETGLQLDGADGRAEFDKLLGDLSKESHASRGVLLGVLVHERPSRSPPAGFFKLAKSVGYRGTDDPQFVRGQTERLFEAFEDPASKARGGELVWVDARGRGLGMLLTRDGKRT